MSDEFESALDKVDAAIAEMKRQDITLGPVEAAVENLRQHSSNIQLLADRTDAIRDEIISPVKSELRKANWIGILSGIFGILLTLGVSLYTIRSQTPLLIQATPQRVDAPPAVQINAPEDVTTLLQQIAANVRTIAIDQIGLNSEYQPANSEMKVLEYRRKQILKSNDHSISVEVQRPNEREFKDGGLLPFVAIQVFVDDQPLSALGMVEFLRLESPKGTARFEREHALLSEGDSIVLNDKSRITVIRIYRMLTNILTRGDKENGMLLRVSSGPATERQELN